MADDEYKIGDYQLINCIATGNYTQVWEVIHPNGGNRLAMKLMLKEAFEDIEHLKVFKHEVKVAKVMLHPKLIRYQDSLVTKKQAYMLMEYFPALNLKIQIGNNLVDLQTRLEKLLEETCQALGYMHAQGWLHRDIKPDNILFNRSSEVRLIDFSLSGRYARGIAKAFAGKQKVIQGTRTYIAPETLLKKPATPQTDIYSLGVTLFEILTGEPPFRGSSPGELLTKHVRTPAPAPSEVNPNVSAEMDALVKKMLSKRPQDRQQSIQELSSELRNVKYFNQDPQKLDEQSKKEAEGKQRQSLDEAQRLDSRSDALRSELRKQNPDAVQAEKKAVPKPPVAKLNKSAETSKQAETAKQPPPPPQAPAPPQPVPYQQPFPPQPYPQQPHPGYYQQPGYPQMPYGAPPPPPQYPQGMPPQYAPMPMPPGQYPPPGVPQYPHAAPPQSPQGVPQPPHGGQPAARHPQQPPQTAPPGAQQSPEADLPLMNELPPIAKETKQKNDLPLMDDLPPVS